MKFSKYNITKEVKDGCLIYNSKNSSLLLLNNKYKKEFEILKENELLIGNMELLENLKKGEMIIEDFIEEEDLIELKNKILKYNLKGLGLTIAPTLECNFACPYCYENGYRNNKMTEKTKNDLIKFVENRSKEIESLNVSWYGGEPLLDLETIELLTLKFKEIMGENKKYSANIVTNGFLLTEEKAYKLKKLHIKNAQITLDGNKNIHDSRRFLLNGKGTFDKIIENIIKCYKIINIVVRINIDKKNSEDIYDIYDIFEKYNLKNKVSFYIAPVDSINDTCTMNNCFDSKEFSDKEIEFFKEGISRGFKILNLKRNNISMCGAVRINSYVIDPLGDLYKCWNHIGRKEFCVGNIGNKINFNSLHIRYLNYTPFERKECKECNVLPLCMGGCPDKYLRDTKRINCYSEKYNISEIIELFYLQKKFGGVK
ncbi:SPASM domain-containing protein [Oceanotoga sp. DSM 15011]|uniref:radical SAM/SPASM domain-containing protein n=1 Tax=Oceanotoga sp. DSM 15011 TaxID=2984951 RepID=UPI0021F4C5D9|nr:radical SAM protein [Oceanotoga sp. DSM 15011]UYP01303.1 SPASM domain-containing protein [Oceanotoga sp. DSM 15011]